MPSPRSTRPVPMSAHSRLSDNPLVTVVIATHNRCSSLLRCLESIECLDMPIEQFEVIVIDDGSHDDTPQVLDTFHRRTPLNFLWYHQNNQGAAAARNRGISAARGAYVAFTDDDCEVHPGWLTNLIAALQTSGAAGVGGRIITANPGLIGDYMDHHHVLSHDTSASAVPTALLTANACYHTPVLRQVGGFDTAFGAAGGEDLDLSWRITKLGYTLAVAPDAVVVHHFAASLQDLRRRFYHYGAGHQQLSALHGLTLEPNPLSRAWGAVSPRYFTYRAREYILHQNLPWYRALPYALFDQIRFCAWWSGYAHAGRQNP